MSRAIINVSDMTFADVMKQIGTCVQDSGVAYYNIPFWVRFTDEGAIIYDKNHIPNCVRDYIHESRVRTENDVSLKALYAEISLYSHVSKEAVVSAAANAYRVDINDIMNSRRKHGNIPVARMVAIHFLFESGSMFQHELASYFKRNHASIYYTTRKANELYQTDRSFRLQYRKFLNLL